MTGDHSMTADRLCPICDLGPGFHDAECPVPLLGMDDQ
jgi:hypothetical protein